jgi:hypothetical protein
MKENKPTRERTIIRAVSMPERTYRIAQQRAKQAGGLSFAAYIRTLISKDAP